MFDSLSSSTRGRVLITGASGFIGKHLVRTAQELGYEVSVAVRPGGGRPDPASSVRAVELDYRDVAGMVRSIEAEMSRLGGTPWRYVIHNAGLTKTADPQEFYEANAENTLRLCRALRDAKATPERFVLMSSLSTYGEPVAEDGVIRSSDEQRPTTHYGRSKMLAEQYVRESGIPYSILQPTGVYGPGDRDYLMAIQSMQRGINFMAGLTPQYLTFVYGEDVARAAWHVAEHPEAVGQTYIVADGDVHTDTSFGLLCKELLGHPRVLNLRAPMPLLWVICQAGSLWARITGQVTPLNTDKYRIMRQRSWRCDASPLTALGYRPLYDLRRGLECTIEDGRRQGLLS